MERSSRSLLPGRVAVLIIDFIPRVICLAIPVQMMLPCFKFVSILVTCILPSPDGMVILCVRSEASLPLCSCVDVGRDHETALNPGKLLDMASSMDRVSGCPMMANVFDIIDDMYQHHDCHLALWQSIDMSHDPGSLDCTSLSHARRARI